MNIPLPRKHASWSERLAQFGSACVYCGESNEKLTRDHLTPLAHGGSNRMANLVPACLRCNGAKADRPFKAFAADRAHAGAALFHPLLMEQVPLAVRRLWNARRLSADKVPTRGAVRWEGQAANKTPRCVQHTEGPRGYVDFFAWAERMSRTHEQRQCPGCGRYVVWKPRGTPPAPPPAHGPTDGGGEAGAVRDGAADGAAER